MWGFCGPEDYSQPSRIGAVAGVSLGVATSLLLEHPLRLDEGLGDSAPGLGAVGAGIGIAEGIVLATLIDPQGEIAKTSNRQIAGGALLGGSAGLATGLVLSKYYTPEPRNLGVTVGGTILGGLFGRGLAMTMQDDVRRDTAGTLAGSLAGMSAFAIIEHVSPLTDVDVAASAAGMAYGGVVGALVPSLSDKTWVVGSATTKADCCSACPAGPWPRRGWPTPPAFRRAHSASAWQGESMAP